jgi:hypothetical protein
MLEYVGDDSDAASGELKLTSVADGSTSHGSQIHSDTILCVFHP